MTDSKKELRSTILGAWRTNCLVTSGLVEALPAALWDAQVPAIVPARQLRTIAAHLHNARSRWIRTLGAEFGIVAPPLVNLKHVTRPGLVAALKRSGRGIEQLLELGLASSGEIPASKAYTWRNLPLDVGHVMAYFVAHEAHHRGQIVLAARQLGNRLPKEVTNGLWQWTARARQWKAAGPSTTKPKARG